ncbi:MAG: SapB/AmfS family lanthipeptide [Actinomycetota bacterium]|jgi:hypothetical protein|nr:SapB/AmfS family lanthipeptide [Actinomycetota bacterium]
MVLLDLQSLVLSGRDKDCDCDGDGDGSFLSLLLCSH